MALSFFPGLVSKGPKDKIQSGTNVESSVLLISE